MAKRPARRAWQGLLAAILLTAATAFAAPARAEEGLDDLLGGFEEDEAFAHTGEDGADEAEPRFWDLSGSLVLGVSYNYLDHHAAPPLGSTKPPTDYQGLSRLRTRLNLQLDLELPLDWEMRVAGFADYDFAYLIQGRSHYTDDVLNRYEWEVDFREVYLEGSPLEQLDLKLGRQVVNWGRSDTLRVLDVLNPLDNREPGLADIEDLRRPVTMAKLAYYLGSWSLTAIAIPEIRFNQGPVEGSDFYPALSTADFLNAVGLTPADLIAMGLDPTDPSFAAALIPRETDPDPFFDTVEYAAALSGIFQGWDVSFHFARFLDDQEHLALYDGTPIPLPPQSPFSTITLPMMVLVHDRLTLVGAGGNYTFGSWLFKAEVAYIDGFDFSYIVGIDNSSPLDPEVVVAHATSKSRVDVMAGIEYYGISDLNIALEVVNRHINDFEDELRGFPNYAQRNALETALRVTANFLNDRLELTALAVVFGEKAQDGSVVRLSADYELRDALSISGGIVLYQSGDLLGFREIGRNDRLFAQVKYSF
jgi:hypothetical protein